MKKINVIFLFLLPLLLTKGWVQAQSVGIRMPDTTSVQGTVLELPLYVDSTFTGKEVYSYFFQLSYNPHYLQPESVIISGTLSEAFGMPVLNTSVPGLVSFAAAGTVPLTGEGKLIIIRWVLKNQGWTRLSFTDVKHNYLNEGMPVMTLKYGDISIQQAPTISIYPDTRVIAKGDHLQMDAYGGTAPYTWSVTDPVLAEIDQTGLLTANAPGFEKVFAVDNFGVRDTTQFIEIRPLKLSIPNDLTQWEGATIDIPVITTNLDGLNITSGIFKIGFNPNVLSPTGVVQAGTILEPCQVFMQKSEGTVSVAFAGINPLAGQDTLVYIRFNVLSYHNGSSNIEIDKALMNENLRVAYSNGYFSVKNFKYRYISPSQGVLVVGESVELNLYGEPIPPWAWSVSDTTVASINQTGILTGKKHGKVMVTVIDSAGAPAESGQFEVFDTRAFIPDTSICHYDRLLEYPLYLENLTHDSIDSFQGKISYDTNRLIYLGIETLGTVASDWISAVNEKDGMIDFASTGTTPLKSPGVLLKLKFMPKPDFVSGSWAGIHFERFTLNEGTPYTLVERYGSVSGISKNMASAEIHVESFPQICEGDTVSFRVFVSYGGTPQYQWLKNGNPIPGETGDTLRTASFVNNDTISCRVIPTDPCVIDSLIYSNKLLMTVHPKPLAAVGISGETTVSSGASGVTYTVPVIPFANSYSWHLSDGVNGFSVSNSITVDFNSTITSALIKVQGVNDCGMGAADSLAVAVSIINGFNSLKSTKTVLFPNPVDYRLHVVLNSNADRDTKIEVYDAIGRLLKVNNDLKGNEMTLDFSPYDSGIYLVKLTYENKSKLFKIIKR